MIPQDSRKGKRKGKLSSGCTHRHDGASGDDSVLSTRPYQSETLLAFMVLAGVLTWGGRTALRIIVRKIRQWNRNVCRLLLVGSNHRAYNFVRCVLATPQLGYHIVGYIDDPWDDSNGRLERAC